MLSLMAWDVEDRTVCSSKLGVYRNLVGILPFWLNPLNRQDLNFFLGKRFVLDRYRANPQTNELLQHWNEQSCRSFSTVLSMEVVL